jgi:hypothetical protein
MPLIRQALYLALLQPPWRQLMKRMIGPEATSGGVETSNDDRSKIYPDTLSQTAALALAKRLEGFWHDRGHPTARFWTEPVGERFTKIGTYDLYRVKCNLINGLPQTYSIR